LGTAVGDGISEGAGIGYGATFGLFSGAIIFLAILWFLKLTDPVTSFWLVFIMTRPLGASLGDCLSSPKFGYLRNHPIITIQTPLSSNYPTSRPTSRPTMLSGGAGMGYGYTSLLFIGIIFLVTSWMTYSKFDQVSVSHEKIKCQDEDQIECQNDLKLSVK
jgi:uncharacterized membrane-anchored protein